MQWNVATEGWSCPAAEINLCTGGRFNYRMQAIDGSAGFDFCGEFIRIDPLREIGFVLDDSREVIVTFAQTQDGIRVTETFEAEDQHTAQQQRDGWQAILNNFKRVAELKTQS